MKMLVLAAIFSVSFATAAHAYVNKDGVSSSLTDDKSQAEYDFEQANSPFNADGSYKFPAKSAHVNVTPAKPDLVGAVSLTEDREDLQRRLEEAQASSMTAILSGPRTEHKNVTPRMEVGGTPQSLNDDSKVYAKAVKCVSEGEYRRCSFDPSNLQTIEVARTTGAVPCVRNNTWGSSYQSLWVDKGCAATFKLIYKENN